MLSIQNTGNATHPNYIANLNPGKSWNTYSLWGRWRCTESLSLICNNCLFICLSSQCYYFYVTNKRVHHNITTRRSLTKGYCYYIIHVHYFLIAQYETENLESKIKMELWHYREIYKLILQEFSYLKDKVVGSSRQTKATFLKREQQICNFQEVSENFNSFDQDCWTEILNYCVLNRIFRALIVLIKIVMNV